MLLWFVHQVLAAQIGVPGWQGVFVDRALSPNSCGCIVFRKENQLLAIIVVKGVCYCNECEVVDGVVLL